MLSPRSASGELTPALLCLALLGGLAAQVLWPVGTEFPPGAAPPMRVPRGLAAAPVPDYPAVLGAPLFSPDRRSLAAGGEHGTATPDDARPTLLGVVSDRRSGSAVIKGSDGAAQVVRLGETWRGWRLVGVGAGSAAFNGPGGRFTALIGAAPTAPAPGASAIQENRP
ncbi:hypothetical protein [Caulobacter soli]|uniref:hypothetical protein n=1 Tax=Caulobacter soli TaxID=2708539 RepID=UPI0013EBDC7D|nr:hypothetical protein [Caulobacter soli]